MSSNLSFQSKTQNSNNTETKTQQEGFFELCPMHIPQDPIKENALSQKIAAFGFGPLKMPRDLKKAEELFQSLAAEGDPEILWRMGIFYKPALQGNIPSGPFEARNPKLAFKYFQQAANANTLLQNVPKNSDIELPIHYKNYACRELADCYIEGFGTEVDYMKAVQYIQLA